MELKITQTIGDTIQIEKNVMTVTISDYEIGLRQMLEAEQSNTTTATDNITLTDSDTVIQVIDPGGADRTVTLPAESLDNHGFLIFNSADADEDLNVVDDASAALATVYQGGAGWFVSNGSSWKSAGLGTLGWEIKDNGTAKTKRSYLNITGAVITDDAVNDETEIDIGYDVVEGRLTLETGVPVSTTGQADKTNVYFTPYKGNKIKLYDATTSRWILHSFTELTLAVGAFTASKPYDIFIYNNAGTLTLSGTVWTNGATRATALTTQDGVLVKTGATNYRYLGTIWIDGSQKCQDTIIHRYLWNYYNKVEERLFAQDITTHTYNSVDDRYYNNDLSNMVDFIVGYVEDSISYFLNAKLKIDNASYIARLSASLNAVTIDTTVLAESNNTDYAGFAISRVNTPALGYNYIAIIQDVSNASSTGSFATYRLHGLLKG